MSTALFYLVVVVLVVAAIKAAYLLFITYLLPGVDPATETHTVTTEDGWLLRLFHHPPREGIGEPVFLCHAFCANHNNFTYPRGESLVDALTKAGYDCWLIDLRGTHSSTPLQGRGRHEATIDDYLLRDIPATLDFICEKTGHDKVHWVGHSMGGMLLYAYEAVHGNAQLASGVTLGSPPGFKNVSVSHQRNILGFIRRFPRLSAFYLRSLAPIVPLLRPRIGLLPVNWSNLHEGVGAQAFHEIVDLPPIGVTESLLDCAAYNRWGVKNNSIDVLAELDKLQTPLFVIHGVLDPLATVENVRTFFKALPSENKQRLELSKANECSADYDHIDLAFSKHAQEEIYGPIAAWLKAHRFSASERPQMEKAPAAAKAIKSTEAPEPDLKPVAPPSKPELMPQTPAPVKAVKESAPPHGHETLWGSALKSAASVLSELDPNASHPPASKPAVKAWPSKAAAKSTSPGAPKARKAKKKTVTKKAAAKKATAKKTSTKKKTTKKARTKKTAAKKPATKKGSPKKRAATKPQTRKAIRKKKAAPKKKPAKKKSVKKAAAKKTGTKRPAKKKAAKKTTKKGASAKAKKKSR